jgi:gliding motility-associated-like protein
MPGPVIPCVQRLRSWSIAVLLGATTLEIESILVDACNGGCPGATEGENEMVRFITGPSPIALGDLTIDWPNNAFRGLVQNATTASLVGQLNGTILSCGYLLEPAGGVIPAGSEVLLITSTDMCTVANSFANLSDTLYVIFQDAGNTSGHFANQNNGANITPAPTGGSALRTLIITYVPTGCSETVTYDRELLVNTSGTYGGSSVDNDGATANFSWPDAPVVTYTNLGCQAPFVPITVTIESGGGDVACGGSTSLVGSVTGDVDEVFWSGGSGSFSDATALTTDYALGGSDAGTFNLTLNAVSNCGDTIRTNVAINVLGLSAPVITPDGPTALCPGASVTLTASGADSYLWSTSDPTASITVNAAGTYTVTGTSACGTATASITVTVEGAPTAAITGELNICAGGSTVLTANGGTDYLWSTTAPTASITVVAAGTYSVQVSNGCGTATASVTVVEVVPTASIMATPITGAAPLAVSFTGAAVPDASTWTWDFGDLFGGDGQNESHTYTTPGEYTVTLVTSGNGCDATAQITIIVVDEVPSTVVVPNVFSPNGDGRNDTFRVISTGLASLNVTIFNRWGQEVATLGRVDQAWSGRSTAGEPLSEGTYFYVLKAHGLDGVWHELKGSVTLLR